MSEGAARRLMVTTVTCVILFLIGSEYAYAQRGCPAVGGEYVLLTVPLIVAAFEWARGGE